MGGMGSERREVIGDKCEVNKDCRRIRPDMSQSRLDQHERLSTIYEISINK
jgi:hypothetical protein